MSHASALPPPSTLSPDQACRDYGCADRAHRCAAPGCFGHRLHTPPMSLCVYHLGEAARRYVVEPEVKTVVLCDWCDSVSSDGKALCEACRPKSVAAVSNEHAAAVAMLFASTPVKVKRERSPEVAPGAPRKLPRGGNPLSHRSNVAKMNAGCAARTHFSSFISSLFDE
jgi:hypothetical protein